MPTTSMMIDALEEWRKNPAGQEADRFWMLVESFRADLVNQAFAILGSQSDAEDVAQESLVSAYLNLDKLRDPQMLGNWMRKINHNAALEHRQKQQRQRQAAEEAGKEKDELGTSHTKALTHQEMVARAIDGLPDDLRAVLVLRYWENLDYQGIAHRLGTPLGTVKSRMARADRELEQRLRPVLGLEPVTGDSVKARR
jgi:RNA polymerase sigma-70 factor (ECF subfamily)